MQPLTQGHGYEVGCGSFVLPWALVMSNPHPKDLLHGVTLEMILIHLVERYGWEELALEIPIRCFQLDPSIKSSLTFLRRTPWARAKVEELYRRSVTGAQSEI